MSPQENTQLIQKMYTAFGEGNIQTILNALTDDVEWSDTASKSVPFGGTYRGRQQVGEFFKKLAEHQDFLSFEPREFIAQGDTVVALGYIKARSKATGKTYESNWAMSFHLQAGKVKKFQDFFDSALAAEAYRKG